MIIHIAVQCRYDIWVAGDIVVQVTFAVHWMSVGLTDDPHTRPTRVTDQGQASIRMSERQAQQLIALNSTA
ncbi:unannotated protein [freshwater metagenome]|uniref:Unannotated protein n=1 Tax=freshwater metagenome TaxID=449393 RepID=A0A6J6VJU3_9ZZZZ